MRDTFPKAYALTRGFEGGNVDDKADRGGRTSRGVTQTTYNDYRKSKGLPQKDVFAMTETEAQEIYYDRYWVPVKGNFLPIGPDFVTYDFGVNSGVSRANAAATATGNYAPADRVKEICAKRTSFVEGIKNFAKFRKGVLARVAKVEVEGVKLALGAALVISPADPPSKFLATDLKNEAANAKAKAASASNKATGAATPTGIVGGSTVATLPNFGWEFWTVFGVIVAALVLVVVYFVYEHRKHTARADAYSDAATAPA